MKQAWKRAAGALQWIAAAVLALALACNLYVLGARIAGVRHPSVFGFSTAIVLSGSMEPALHVDDLIVVRAQEAYSVGDVVTFESGGSLVTHRIAGETAEGFVTRGDANNADDGAPVAPGDIVGRVVLRIPVAGAALAFLRTPPGMTLLVLCALLLLERPLLARWLRGGAEGQDHA